MTSSRDNNQSQELIAAANSLVDENVNTNKMIQQSVNVQAPPPPRLHPKKRKFDLSELEDDHNQHQTTVSAVSAVHSAVSSPIIISSNPSSSCATSSSAAMYQHHHNQQHQRMTSEMILTTQHQNGNQQNVQTTASVGYNPHITQIVKNTGEVQQIIKRQSFMNYR